MIFDWNMTIETLVTQMNNGGSQEKLYNASKINKDVIPYLFKAAGYIREKQKYIATADVQSTITIEQLLPLAKQMQKETKIKKMQKTIEEKPVIVDISTPPTIPNVGDNVTESIFNTANKQEIQRAILDVLDITADDLAALRTLKDEAPATTNNIYDAINKLSSRKRSNKTYYISDEVVQKVQEFTEAKTIKVSQFIEIALLEAIKKYS